MRKKELSILLSKLRSFQKQDLSLEQYQTECEIAAEFLWQTFMEGSIKGRVIADLGCGNGILGVGALILGAKKVIFVDVDEKALNVAKENKIFVEEYLYSKFNSSFVHKDVKNFKMKVDVVLQNPPFGVKVTYADKVFLAVAMRSAPLVYSFHKIETKKFVDMFVKDNGFRIKKFREIDFPLKKTKSFHRKKVHYVKVGIWKIEKLKNAS